MSHCKTMVPMRGLGGQWTGGAVTVRRWYGTWMMSSRVSRAMRDTSAARLPSTCVSISCSGGLGLHSNTSLVDHSSLNNIGLPFHSRQTALCFGCRFFPTSDLKKGPSCPKILVLRTLTYIRIYEELEIIHGCHFCSTSNLKRRLTRPKKCQF